MKNERGFSLIELLVVVGILMIISAIAIPGLKRARQNANAGSAIQSLRTITTAEYLYEKKFKRYGTLAQLAPEGTIDSHIGTGLKSAYSFTLTLTSSDRHFSVSASPLDDPTRLTHYFVDDSGVIRYNEGAPATVASPAIPR
ncbi:MAG TPA: prepilin-type N-terminal cleavage/methylation domain-containing protein [Blastocatellia bacterium]|nr:prepilin-type N-terminal cleavage/methylation domain-containing protein [Blastocatellia bacterium]